MKKTLLLIKWSLLGAATTITRQNRQDGPGQSPTMALRQRGSTAPSAVVALVNLQSPDCRGGDARSAHMDRMIEG